MNQLPGIESITALLSGMTIWTVDDNEDCANSTAALLDAYGAHARAMTSGSSFLAAAKLSPPDLALIDLGMPEMDGYQVAHEVRRAAGPLSGITLCALSGWGDPANMEKSAQAGFDFHLVKPLEFDQLIDKLMSVRQHPRTPAGGTP